MENQAIKDDDTPSFTRYCELRDGKNAYYIYKGVTRKWLNDDADERGSAGIRVLWPDMKNAHFIEALQECNAGERYNNTSAVIRYHIQDGASFMWLGDLETDFMEKIVGSIDLAKTTIVFASHHGRRSGKIPDSWLEKLKPQLIVIGEAPSRHLHYYTGYRTITQNSAGDITMDCDGEKIHFYVSNEDYSPEGLTDEGMAAYGNYVGSLTIAKTQGSAV